jgi:hypothetical protein
LPDRKKKKKQPVVEKEVYRKAQVSDNYTLYTCIKTWVGISLSNQVIVTIRPIQHDIIKLLA